jgi:hypothetical protein
MATFSPIITVYPNDAVRITSVSDLTYETVNASVGTGYYYDFKNFYQFSQSINQLLEPIYLLKFSKQGDRNVYYLNNTVDPYQKTSALSVDAEHLDYRFDSNNAFIPRILGNSTLFYRFDIQELSNEDFLTKGESNFGMLEFYENYEIDF